MDKEALKKEIEIEIENIEKLVKEMDEITKRFTDMPDFIKTRAAGSILHDFYCGVEKIFERIAIQIDGGLPKSEEWHTELLLQMAQPIEGFRDSVISKEIMEKLKEYLRFRHLFRHIYGFELKWEWFKSLALSLNRILNELKNELERVLK